MNSTVSSKILTLPILTVLLAGMIFFSQPPLVFADNSFAIVSIPSGTAVPGCEITSSCFAPTKVAIAQGGQVTWLNADTAAHTVTSVTPSKGVDGHFDSGMILAGSTFSVSLDDSGKYPYWCQVHPWMLGTIVVEDAEPEHEPEPKVTKEIEHEPEPEQEVSPPAPTGTDVIIGFGTAVPGCEETNSCFTPSTFSIDSGEHVTWYNADNAYHTVISGDPADANSVGKIFDSGLFGPREAYDYQFNQLGTFPYWCIVHPWMTGTIIVEEPEPEVEEPEQDVISKPVVEEPKVTPEPAVESPSAMVYVHLTKSDYNTGDIITINGAVSKNIGGTVSIFVTSPDDNLMVFEQVKVDSANNFAVKVQTGSTIWDTLGTYTVKAQYGTSIDEEFFEYQANELTPKSTPESSPPIVPIDTPDDPAPQNNEELEQLIEDNKILREELERQGEEIDELNEEVDYLKNLIESIQGFFGSIFG